ncbi:MAG: DNA-3-methyladenine glycosylase I [Maricaulaceae bacterium]
MIRRCDWVPPDDALYCAYHDEEWGVPERDSRALYEKLVLDGMQAGLAWITILRKRDTIRAAFDGFDPVTVAAYGEAETARILNDPGVIRSKSKTAAAIGNARAFLELEAKNGSFSDYLWGFVDGRPIQNAWASIKDAPTQTPISQALSKDLKKRGFKFCGPVIVYAFMQAMGMVNDHIVSCHRYESVRALG